MIRAITSMEFTAINENNQSLEENNNTAGDDFKAHLLEQLSLYKTPSDPSETEQILDENNSAVNDDMAAIREKGLVAYIMEQHAKRVREEVLELLGVTEEEIDEMSPEQRDAIEKRIAREIQKRMAAESYMQNDDSQAEVSHFESIVSGLNIVTKSEKEEIENTPLFQKTREDEDRPNLP